MQLVIYCIQCLKRNNLKIKAETRVDLKMHFGNTIEIKCKRCNTKRKYHLTEIKAENRYSIFFISVLFTILFVFLFNVLFKYNWHKSGSVFFITNWIISLSISLYNGYC
jgi:hypothetical protein